MCAVTHRTVYRGRTSSLEVRVYPCDNGTISTPCNRHSVEVLEDRFETASLPETSPIVVDIAPGKTSSGHRYTRSLEPPSQSYNVLTISPPTTPRSRGSSGSRKVTPVRGASPTRRPSQNELTLRKTRPLSFVQPKMLYASPKSPAPSISDNRSTVSQPNPLTEPLSSDSSTITPARYNREARLAWQARIEERISNLETQLFRTHREKGSLRQMQRIQDEVKLLRDEQRRLRRGPGDEFLRYGDDIVEVTLADDEPTPKHQHRRYFIARYGSSSSSSAAAAPRESQLLTRTRSSLRRRSQGQQQQQQAQHDLPQLRGRERRLSMDAGYLAQARRGHGEGSRALMHPEQRERIESGYRYCEPQTLGPARRTCLREERIVYHGESRNPNRYL